MRKNRLYDWLRKNWQRNAADLAVRQRSGGIASPLCLCWNLLAFHEEGIGGEYCLIAHRHTVVDEGTNPKGDARTDLSVVRLEGAVLQRVTLDLAPRIERAIVPDTGERPLRQVYAVIEGPLANSHAQQTPDHVLERGTIEHVEVRIRHLPEALVPPIVSVVNGTATLPLGILDGITELYPILLPPLS